MNAKLHFVEIKKNQRNGLTAVIETVRLIVLFNSNAGLAKLKKKVTLELLFTFTPKKVNLTFYFPLVITRAIHEVVLLSQLVS